MSAGRPPRGQRRGTVVLVIVAVALLAFGTTTQTWLEVRLPEEAVQTPDLAVPGSEAATPVSAFALVALAAALAVSIAGRVARWFVAAILLIAGGGIVADSVLADEALETVNKAAAPLRAALAAGGLRPAGSSVPVAPAAAR